MEAKSCLTAFAWVVFLLTVVCQFSGLTKYYLKKVAFPLMLAVGSLVSLPRALLHPRDYRGNALFFARICDWWSWALGIRWRVRVDEEVDQGRSYVIVSNHQSSLDTLAMLKIWHLLGNTMLIGKKEIIYYGWFGLTMLLHGTILIDRSRGRHTISESGRRAKEMGASLFVYPEGTRHRKRDLNFLPFKKGAFHVAVDNNMDILPIVVSQYDFFNQDEGTFEPGEPTIRIMRPISVDGYDKTNLNELVQLTQKTMHDAFLELSHQGELVRDR